MAAPILTLDFKRDAFVRKNIGILLLLGGIGAGMGVALAYAVADKALLQVRQQTAELRRQGAPEAQPQSTMDVTQLAAEVKHANEIIRQLNMPWDKLFMALESAAHKDVALLSIQPDIRKQMLNISGEARNMEAMLDYLSQLRGQETLAKIVLSGHEIKLQDPDKPVRFSLSAKWVTRR